MFIEHSPKKLIAELNTLRYRGGSRCCVSLVVTRGNLHDGHGAVMNAAKTVSDLVVVVIVPSNDKVQSNVVTATEFQDIGFVEQHGTDILYIPPEDLLYPRGSEQMASLQMPQTCFEQSDSELTLYLKVINTIQPDIMVWGEKNYIEFHHVRQLVRDLDIRTQMQCIPTVRHANGVAVSAHDNLLNVSENQTAPILFETLRNVAHAIRTGARTFSNLEKTARLALREAGFCVDIFAVLDEDNLQPATNLTTSYRIVGSATMDGIPIEDSLGLTL